MNMKKQYICPKSEVIDIECDSLLLNTSPGAADEGETLLNSEVLLDGDTDTDEQW